MRPHYFIKALIIFVTVVFLSISSVFAQTSEDPYLRGKQDFQRGDFSKAIEQVIAFAID